MGKSESDEKILSYEDVVLRRSDLDILSGHHFLNDRIIEFYFSYLSSNYSSQDILLIPPSIAFWIANCPDPNSLKEFVEPLKLIERKLVIFPVNNNDDVNEAEGGSHWSLLVFLRSNGVFVHHDSCRGINKWYAKQLYKSIVPFLHLEGDVKYIDHEESPRQVNGYDCGLYVTAIARIVCSWYAADGENGNGLWFSELKEANVAPFVVSGMRNEILELIRGLMANSDRTRASLENSK